MRTLTHPIGLATLFVFFAIALSAQPAQRQTGVPPSGERVITVTGVFQAVDGRPTRPSETVTYSIYSDEVGGTLLWQETQTVAVDSQGHYAFLLGAMNSEGLPADLFATGESRWLGVQWQGEAERKRSLLTAVPYAVKAGDADTLGGRPATDYLLNRAATDGKTTNAGSPAGEGGNNFPSEAPPVSSGTAGFIGKFVDPVNLGDSVMFESAGRIGVNTTTPQDIIHARFTNTGGTATGIAVQNLGSTASSYSGMLFYDHLGALGQFQGFNNSTHEYRINNIASGGTINFMLGSVSQFRILNNGDVGLGAGSNTPDVKVHMFSSNQDGVTLRGSRLAGTLAAPTAVTNGSNLLRMEGSGYTGAAYSQERATIQMITTENWSTTANGVEMNFYTTANGTTAVTQRMTILNDGKVGIGTAAPVEELEVAGDIRANGGDFRPLGTTSDGVRWVDATNTIMAHMHRFGSSNNNLYVTNAGASNLTGVFLAPSATSWTSTSDERLKTDIEPVTGILGKIRNIRVVGFNMYGASASTEKKHSVIDKTIKPRVMRDGTVIKQQIGSIAQDWLKDFPELVVEPTSDNEYYGLNYERLGVVALGGVKELAALLEAKDEEIRALNARLTALEQALLAQRGVPTP